ncbi:hypothetical protein F4802DRAFT_547043 [Xylaria palmicola]|nr:hypothetical protein F4802DRAFT_547043 [Xylaria palmicola]
MLSSVFGLIRRASRKDPAVSCVASPPHEPLEPLEGSSLPHEPREPLEGSPPPYEPPAFLEDSPPPYERIDSNPVCTEGDIMWFVYLPFIKTGVEICRAKGSREAVMSRTIRAFEVGMETAFAELRRYNLAFDFAKCALLMAAMTVSLARVRSFALFIDSSNTSRDREKTFDIVSYCREEIIFAGVDAGTAAIYSMCQMGIDPIPYSEIDVVLRRVARKAATMAVQGAFKNTTRRREISGVVDTLDVAIRAGVDFGVPYNNSVAVFKAALTAALTASRSHVALLSHGSGRRSKRWMIKTENEATEAGVRAGKQYCY